MNAKKITPKHVIIKLLKSKNNKKKKHSQKKVIVIDLNVRVKNNISEANIGEYPQVLELDKDFLDVATKLWSITEK